MKKMLSMFVLTLSTGALFALPAFNPASPTLVKDGMFLEGCGDKPERDCCSPITATNWCDFANWCDQDFANLIGIRAGYYGDFVQSRKMKVHDVRAGSNDGTVFGVARRTEGAIFTLSFADKMELFGTLGYSKYEVVAGGSNFIEARDSSAWSIGASTLLWSCDCMAVGLNGQYAKSKIGLDLVAMNDADKEQVGRSFAKEWQVSLGSSWWLHLSSTGNTGLAPYVSLAYSKARQDALGTVPRNNTFGATHLGDAATTTILERGISTKHWGLAIGSTLVANGRASITVERRLFAEEAVHVNAQFRL